MKHAITSIRPFIGSADFEESRNFYLDLGFEEAGISSTLSYFKSGNTGFYLQNAYVKDWIDNLMIFVEVDDVDRYWEELNALNLPAKYVSVRLTAPRVLDWGKECFIHDPSGILWHFGQFYTK